ncbi:hypothetical protein GGX14DRAFT_606881 [Mycena pura]|uniref:Uncharacterized protein n=1 Tax=Mycena pura TaxID=153505 RepID=A0AAD6VPF9_9AGAR|nr:hypothetical protein GGX14DRAFT_606881 [Mycena pura]
MAMLCSVTVASMAGSQKQLCFPECVKESSGSYCHPVEPQTEAQYRGIRTCPKSRESTKKRRRNAPGTGICYALGALVLVSDLMALARRRRSQLQGQRVTRARPWTDAVRFGGGCRPVEPGPDAIEMVFACPKNMYFAVVRNFYEPQGPVYGSLLGPHTDVNGKSMDNEQHSRTNKAQDAQPTEPKRRKLDKNSGGAPLVAQSTVVPRLATARELLPYGELPGRARARKLSCALYYACHSTDRDVRCGLSGAGLHLNLVSILGIRPNSAGACPRFRMQKAGEVICNRRRSPVRFGVGIFFKACGGHEITPPSARNPSSNVQVATARACVLSCAHSRESNPMALARHLRSRLQKGFETVDGPRSIREMGVTLGYLALMDGARARYALAAGARFSVVHVGAAIIRMPRVTEVTVTVAWRPNFENSVVRPRCARPVARGQTSDRALLHEPPLTSQKMSVQIKGVISGSKWPKALTRRRMIEN